jgi:Holliday junction resolvasome RuvABC endonuclease subunit
MTTPPTTSRAITALGIDPGFACGGAVVLRQDAYGEPIRFVGGALLETKKAGKKERRSLRVTDDDARRVREIFRTADALRRQHDVNVIGVESYMPYGRNASGWKAGGVYYGFIMLGGAWRIPVLPFVPQDLKRAFHDDHDVSKEAIGRTLAAKVEGLGVFIEKHAKSKREHLTDAAGHAYLAVVEAYNLRQIIGV